ncbi:nucleotidyltransferase domain-containing protein [Priestia megaterium]|uniref:Nucleotidyltransferase domain-containing protein n=1 Tax=Priestia megaterium TaxID=1404 RepID=A0A3D8X0A6_PRIMG|nr:nucleotidyltransferase domain-containing protein [Priestia megaterium]MDH3171240.1 nucleotidyltransferase domain-containing protein [Priestia megaterium]RDZ13347.1 nucleotidyltransferase domain-containing protein [Priestia megaterium]
MKEIKRLEPLQAATQFIFKHYPNCQGALLAGSVVRGESTRTSELDLVIFDENFTSSFRESLIEFGWAIEVFAHNLTSYQAFFKSDCKRARPSLPRMISGGIILVGKEIVQSIKEEAKHLLEKGPEKWPEETIRLKRYFISDALDDLIGSLNPGESLFIANTLAYITHEFVLRTNGHWIGDSKWIVRSLNDYNKSFSKEFVEAFDTFYKTGSKDKVIQLVDKVLAPHGGRLFEGFSLGKEG